MNRDLYSHAIDLEGHDPRKAIKVYSRLCRENLKFSWEILVAWLAGPVIAFGIAVWVRSRFNLHDALITLPIWVGVGTFPGIMMYAWRRRKATGRRANFLFNTIFLVFIALCIYFGTFLHAVTICFYTLITFVVLHLIANPIYYLLFGTSLSSTYPPYDSETLTFESPASYYFAATIFTISIVYGFVLVMADPVRLSDPLWPHLFKFKRMLIALRLRWKRALFFVLAFYVGVCMRKANLDVIYGTPLFGLGISLIGGTFFALEYGFLERNVVFGHLLRLAMVRCALLLGNQEKADLLLMLEEEQCLIPGAGFKKIRSSYPKIIGPLKEASRILVLYADQTWNPDRQEAGDLLRDSENAIRNVDQNRNIYLDAIHRTREILYPYLDEYTAVARVLRSEFYYPPGDDPRNYERFEYEYYKTGQRIDVEVIDGQIYFDQLYFKGDRITGIWGCDETDLGYVQILGKPEVGDLVGYYTNRLSCGAPNLNWVRISEEPKVASGEK